MSEIYIGLTVINLQESYVFRVTKKWILYDSLRCGAEQKLRLNLNLRRYYLEYKLKITAIKNLDRAIA